MKVENEILGSGCRLRMMLEVTEWLCLRAVFAGGAITDWWRASNNQAGTIQQDCKGSRANADDRRLEDRF